MSRERRREILRSWYRKVIGTYMSSSVEGSDTGSRPDPHFTVRSIYVHLFGSYMSSSVEGSNTGSRPDPHFTVS